MKLIEARPNLVEQVQEAVLTEIAEGKFRPGERLIQEQIARQLGVSRQPIQQALLLLRNQGVLRDAPGRGLIVAPLDLDYVKNMYDMRAVVEGLACRLAAQLNAKRARKAGPKLLEDGRDAVAAGNVGAMIAADMAFHKFLYQLAENPLIGPAMESHWSSTQRVMGEVLLKDQKPRDIWGQHAAILDTVMDGDSDAAERLAREHIQHAADFMIHRLKEKTGTVG